MEHLKLIHDEVELKWYFDNVMPPFAATDVYFVSLSGRNKYLDDAEKKEYILGRNEMFCKTIIRERNWEAFLRTIRRFECDTRGYLTKNGKAIPTKAIVCYANINPSNSLVALNEFQKVVNEYMFELSRVTVKNLNSSNIMARLNKVDDNMMKSYQKATSVRYWIDVDMDVDKGYNPYEDNSVLFYFDKKGIKTFYFVDTKSGYHILLKKDELKFNPAEIIDFLTRRYAMWLENQYTVKSLSAYEDWKAKLDDCEIVVNRNQMIPLVGTYQGGYPVTILNKRV